MRIIFVCTGNTCRSPMAKFILENLLTQYNRSDITVLSAGLMASIGEPISQHAFSLLSEKNIDASSHRASLFSLSEIEPTSLILTMSPSHKKNILQLYPHLSTQTFTLCEYVGEPGTVADPFGESLAHYKDCMAQINHLIAKLYLTF